LKKITTTKTTKTIRTKTKAPAAPDIGLWLVKLCREAAEDKKAEDIVVLDMRKVSTLADYLMICSGGSEPHVRTIADEIVYQAREQGVRPKSRDGSPKSRWMVVDYGDVMIHVMHPELREHYALESLWGDAKRVK